LFVRRPVLALVLNLLIIVAGIAAFLGIEIRELPNVDRPVITIRFPAWLSKCVAAVWLCHRDASRWPGATAQLA
jgi:hypothetical protein